MRSLIETDSYKYLYWARIESNHPFCISVHHWTKLVVKWSNYLYVDIIGAFNPYNESLVVRNKHFLFYTFHLKVNNIFFCFTEESFPKANVIIECAPVSIEAYLETIIFYPMITFDLTWLTISTSSLKSYTPFIKDTIGSSVKEKIVKHPASAKQEISGRMKTV